MLQLHYGQRVSKSKIRLAFLLCGAAVLGIAGFFAQKQFVKKYEEWRFRSQFQRLFEEEKLSIVLNGKAEDFRARNATSVLPEWPQGHVCVLSVVRDAKGVEHYLLVGFQMINLDGRIGYTLNFHASVPRIDASKPSDLKLIEQHLGSFEIDENSLVVVGPSSVLRGPPDVAQIEL